MLFIGDSMTNDEYQRQAREKSRIADQERFRQGVESYNQQQRAQKAKRDAEATAVHSRRMGEMGAFPVGPINAGEYTKGLYEHNRREAEKKKSASTGFNSGYHAPQSTNYSAPAPTHFSHTDSYPTTSYGGPSGYSSNYGSQGGGFISAVKRGFFGIVSLVLIIFVIAVAAKIFGGSKSSGSETTAQPETVAPVDAYVAPTDAPPKPSAGQLETPPPDTRPSDFQSGIAVNTPPPMEAPTIASASPTGGEAAVLSAQQSPSAWPAAG